MDFDKTDNVMDNNTVDDNQQPIDSTNNEPASPVDNTNVDNNVDNGDNESPQTEQVNVPENYIPKEKVSEIVRQRVNELNKKYSNYETYKSTIDKLIKLSGLTEEQFFKQLEQVELQQQAQQMGVSPEIARQIQESQRAAEMARQQALEMKYAIEEQQLIQNPMYKEVYDKVKDEIREFANKTGTSLEQALWAIKGKELAEYQTKMTEHRVQHNYQYKQQRNTVENEGGAKTPNNPGASLSDYERRIAQEMGMSPDEYALYANEDFDYDKIMEMQRKRRNG